MSHAAAKVRLAIVELGLPPVVLQIFDTDRMPRPFRNHFSYPREVLGWDRQHLAAWGCPDMVPLWDDGNAGVVVAHCPDAGKQGFFRFELEGKIKPPVGMGWQQVLVREFQMLWLYQKPEDELQAIADAFQFKHLGQLVRELKEINTYSVTELDPWYQDFVKRVGPG